MADETTLPEITINIKGPSELKLAIQISPSSTVSELKDKIASSTDIEKERQRLIYSGKVLKDDDPLSTHKIQNGHSIHLVKGAAKPSSSTPSAAATSTARSNPASTGVPANMGAGIQFAGNPLAQLEGIQGHGMGGGVFNPFADLGAGNLNDPNALNDLMNSPESVSRMMSMLTPEMIDQIIATNPGLAGMDPQVREMMRSPMMREMMSNPEMIRQMMAMQGRGGPFGAGAGGLGGVPSFPPANAFGSGTAASGGANPSTAGNATAGAGAPGSAPPNPFAGLFGAPGGAAAGTPANPFGGMDPAMMQRLMGLGGGGLGGFGGGFGGPATESAAPAVPADTRPLEERFQSQLLQLNEMGLIDPQQNIRALQITGGNVEAAIELIFSGRVPPSS